MARILYLHRDPSWAGFIADDARILRRDHLVEDVRFEYGPPGLAALGPQVARADLVYFWWGDVTGCLAATVARALGRPSIMITGGYDVAWVPEIGYGLRGRPVRGRLVPLTLTLATRVVANAEIMRRTVVDDYGVPPGKVEAIPHGVDPDEIEPGPLKRERLAITCGQVGAATIRRKGIDTFVEAARRLPDCRFVVLGRIADDAAARQLISRAPDNVHFTGFVERADLLDHMRRASVVVQASAHEGFGVALAEAMLAGATPVVTDRGALPEVVGDVGAYVPYADPRATAEAIAALLDTPQPEASRARIADCFPLEQRAERILALVDRLLQVRG